MAKVEKGSQETTGIERALQKEHGASTDEAGSGRSTMENTSGETVCSGTICLGVPKHHTSKGQAKIAKEMERTFLITEVHQQGRFYRLSTGRAAHYENLKPHVPSPKDWYVPQNMEGLEYLLVEPACEVNQKDTREKNDGNEDVSMDDNEKIDVDSDERSFAEEDWNDPEQKELPQWTEPDLPRTAGTRNSNRKRTSIGYNRYGDDFLIDKIQPEEIF